MKTPEEWQSIYETDDILFMSEMIEQAQKEAWNAALIWAAENAKVKNVEQPNAYYDPRPIWDWVVDKESILKGKL